MAAPNRKPCRNIPQGFSAFRAWRGFSLIELVAILVLPCLLAVTALPRMVQVSSFSQLGFADQVRSALRFGQKTAIAQRRWVKLTDQAGGFALSYCAGSGGDGCAANTASCNSSLIDPASGQPFAVTAPAEVALSHDAGYAGSFYFDCAGRPVSAAGSAVGPVVYTLSAADSVATAIVVEAETGYVH
ncbi:MAG: hypothetical protein FIA97_06280 [Methylococcaceae bacterium]|nr:hypothetical protein [Methylococcaceae bacterium]